MSEPKKKKEFKLTALNTHNDIVEIIFMNAPARLKNGKPRKS